MRAGRRGVPGRGGRWVCARITLCFCVLPAIRGAADERPPAESDVSIAEPNVTRQTDAAMADAGRVRAAPLLPIPTPTLGGGVLWGDVLLAGGYRVQERVGSGDACRLLSPRDLKLAVGTAEECRRALDAHRRASGLEPPSGEVVVLIHGILRSSKSMSRVAAGLRRDGLQPELFDYPSTRVSLEESAVYLRRVIDGFPPSVTRISFVVHSMGGLLVRQHLRDAGGNVDPRLHRMVMIGTPNYGANLATMLEGTAAFQLLFGPAGAQLADHDTAPAAGLPTPAFEFAVIAGIRGTASGFNPLVPGDDDGTVSLASARLAGARDFLAVRGLHSSLMFQPSVVAAASRFIRTGSLHEDGALDPIDPPPAPPVPHQE